MQMMAHWAGTSLNHVDGHVQTRHKLTGQIAEVNSFHDFSIANCPDNFKVLANSEDGEIEAISHLFYHGKDGCGIQKGRKISLLKIYNDSKMLMG